MLNSIDLFRKLEKLDHDCLVFIQSRRAKLLESTLDVGKALLIVFIASGHQLFNKVFELTDCSIPSLVASIRILVNLDLIEVLVEILILRVGFLNLLLHKIEQLGSLSLSSSVLREDFCRSKVW